MKRIALLILALLMFSVGLTACAQSDGGKTSDYAKVEKKSAGRHVYLPKHDVEFNNYNHAQQIFDDPSTIIWCSTTWGNPSAPIVTIPIAGKLTSSTVSYFPNQIIHTGDSNSDWQYNPELKSVDGMYHGSPPPYRYGFTPGGQYVDLFNMPTVCTTALTKFQRQATKVSLDVDPAAASAQKRAEDALKKGTLPDGTITKPAQDAAQRILSGALNG